jgi:sigma-B regulation protein RsbU (phosphoserine phosphatase)
MAARLQAHVMELNQAPADALDVVARTSSLKIVGGDYYDFVDLGQGRTGVVVADVSGKGLPAALFMPAVRIALRSIVTRVQEPTAILEELNAVLYDTTEARSYVTMFLASIEPDSGALTYVNAGHIPGLLIGGDGSVRWLTTGGTPLGLFPAASFESGAARLDPDGVLLLYTDGVTDAENARGEHFGTDRLAAVVRRDLRGSSEAIVAAIHEAVESFVGGGEGNDDMTVIACRTRMAPR